MAFVDRTNNRVMANNSRAVDVARKTIEEVIDVQQQKIFNAFPVQGYPGIYYSRLHSGRRCTCQSEDKVLSSILGEDGKADSGTINKMLTGNPNFGIEEYGKTPSQFQVLGDEPTAPNNSQNEWASAFGPVTIGNTDPFPAGKVDVDSDWGANGPADLLSVLDDFDPGSVGFGDYACPVCFGTSFVGGYAVDGQFRQVWAAHQLSLDVGDSMPGTLNIEGRPWTATTEVASSVVTLPRGILSITGMRAWNGRTQIPYALSVNGESVNNLQSLSKFCTGTPSLFVWRFPKRSTFTHIELQALTTSVPMWFEFPKLSKGQDLSMLDNTEPFQILMSPNVAHVQVEDVIVDAVYGKAMVVQSVNPWQIRSRQGLGWEAQVRVVQPQELLNLLMRPPKVPTKTKTTRMVGDNRFGPRRV